MSQRRALGPFAAVAGTFVLLACAAPAAEATMPREATRRRRAIAKVILSAADTVVMTLAAVTSLRDSDDTPSQYGDDLWNWGVNIDVSVP